MFPVARAHASRSDGISAEHTVLTQDQADYTKVRVDANTLDLMNMNIAFVGNTVHFDIEISMAGSEGLVGMKVDDTRSAWPAQKVWTA